MPKSVPVPPPRSSLGAGKLKNHQLKLLLENEFTIENFVNQERIFFAVWRSY